MMQQNHDWYIDLIPAHAIGATDDDERAAVDAHVTTCPECRALLEEYRGLGDGLLFATPLTPAPAGQTEKLRKRLRAAEQPTSRAWWQLLRKPAWVIGAGALALLILTNLYWAGRVSTLERQASDFSALAQAPGITLRVANPAEGGYDGRAADGVVYVQPGSKVALLCVYALPQLAPGKTYQAWLVQDGQRVSAGTFSVNHDGYGVLLIDAGKPVSEYQQLGITVEPEGGSPAPTSPRVIGGTL